jgi:uncharacterized membrane protein
LVSAVGLAFGADLPYSFVTLDVVCPPGVPNCVAFPDDVNDDGAILSNIQVNNLTEALIATPINPKGNKFKRTPPPMFSCTGIPFADTAAYSINASRQIAGGCADAPSAPSKLYGFVRNQNGDHILLDFPGADGTTAYGISDNGRVTGQFAGPLRTDHGGALSYRFHCFTWNPVTNQYQQIDYPVPNTYVSCNAINKKGQILVEHITVDLGNNYLEHGWSIYDNGIWTLLGLTFEHAGGPWVYFADLNNDGAVVGLRATDVAKIVLYDDGVEFTVTGIPAGWTIGGVSGMNNKGEFVGSYSKLVPGGHEIHGFIATPAPVAAAKGRK